MKFLNLDKKSRRGMLGVLLGGAVIAATIMFWKGDGAQMRSAGEQERGHSEAARGADHGEHAKEGIVRLSDAQIKDAGLRTQRAGPAMIAALLHLPGEIRFDGDRTAHITPRVAGVVERVPASLGEHVKRGQALAVISSTTVAEMRSELLVAKKRLGLAQVTCEREKQLWQEKISAQQDYLEARQALREAEIAVQTAQQKLNALGADAHDGGTLNRFTLRAPFEGTIVEKNIALGEAVKDDANVFTLSDLSTVWAEIIVSATDLDAVHVGAKAKIKATTLDSTATGTVSHVGALLGEQTRTATARVILPNPKMAWRPGLFVDVELQRDRQEVPVAVLLDAVQTVEGKPTVFVRVDGGFKAQPVKTGRDDGRYVEILDGLAAGTPYVASGSFVLKAELEKSGGEDGH